MTGGGKAEVGESGNTACDGGCSFDTVDGDCDGDADGDELSEDEYGIG